MEAHSYWGWWCCGNWEVYLTVFRIAFWFCPLNFNYFSNLLEVGMGIRGCIYNPIFLHSIIFAERLLNSARPIFTGASQTE